MQVFSFGSSQQAWASRDAQALSAHFGTIPVARTPTLASSWPFMRPFHRRGAVRYSSVGRVVRARPPSPLPPPAATPSRARPHTCNADAGIYVPLLAERVLKATPGLLAGVAVGNGCIGFGVTGGCGLDALELLVTTLERRAPRIARTALSEVRGSCAGELDQGRTAAELSAPCASAMAAMMREAGEFNTYHWASACGAAGQVSEPETRTATCRAVASPRTHRPTPTAPG